MTMQVQGPSRGLVATAVLTLHALVALGVVVATSALAHAPSTQRVSAAAAQHLVVGVYLLVDAYAPAQATEAVRNAALQPAQTTLPRVAPDAGVAVPAAAAPAPGAAAPTTAVQRLAVLAPAPASAPVQWASDPDPAPPAAAAAATADTSTDGTGSFARVDTADRMTAPAIALVAPGAAPPRPQRTPPDHATCQPARHPAVLRERGVEGEVQLRVLIDADGRAREVHLAASSGWRLLDEAAQAQARSCRFQPATVDGVPVDSWAEYPVRFALASATAHAGPRGP